MPSHRRSPPIRFALLALPLAAAACSDDDKGKRYEGLHTTVVPTSFAPGGAAQVACTLDKGGKGLLPTDFTARLVPESGPAGGAALSGVNPGISVGGTGAGTYRVFCEIPKLPLADTVGALVTITPGRPVKTRPVFGQNPVEAGSYTSLACVGVDEWNNEVPLLGATFDLPSDLRQQNGEVMSEVAGSYPVTCGVGDTTRESVTLVVAPAGAFRVELSADPERVGYKPDAVVTLSWTVYDRYENVLADVPGTLSTPTAPPLTVLDAEAHKFRLEEEGIYHFSVVLDAPLAGMRDDLDLLVDDTKPVVIVDYPPRGTTMKDTDNGGGPVVVRGSVSDAGGIETLSINGEEVPLSGGRFEWPVESKWGLNIIDVIALDKAGNVGEASPTYGYSDGWLSFDQQNARGLQQEDGLVVLLGQNFFDDGVHNHSVIDDIATLIEVIVGDIDIQTPISQALSGVNQVIPLANQTMRVDLVQGVTWIDLTLIGDLTITLKATNTTDIGPTVVDIDSRDGGLDLDLTIGSDTQPAIAVDLQFEVKLQFDVLASSCTFGVCVPLTSGQAIAQGLVTSHLAMGDFDLFMAIDMDKTWHNPMHLAVTDLTSVVGDFDLAPIDDIVLNLSITGIQGLINTQYTIALSDFVDLGQLLRDTLNPIANQAGALVPQLLNPVIQALIGPVLSGLFDLLVIDTLLPIPNPLGGDSIELGFSTELSNVAFTDDGGKVGLATGIYADKGIDLAELGHEGDLHEEDPEGAILRGDCLGTSTDELLWEWDPSVGIGVRTDVLNAAFYAAWWNGALNAPLDLAALGGDSLPLPIQGLQIDMEWLLPPIVDDCSKAGIQAQIGDVFLTLSGELNGAHIDVGIYLDLMLDVEFVSRDGSDGQPQGLSLSFGAITDSNVEIAYLDDGGGSMNLEALLQALPSLLGSFITGREFGPFSLPSMDLSQLVPGLPSGTTLGLGPLSVSTQAGYAVIGADLGQ